MIIEVIVAFALLVTVFVVIPAIVARAFLRRAKRSRYPYLAVAISIVMGFALSVLFFQGATQCSKHYFLVQKIKETFGPEDFKSLKSRGLFCPTVYMRVHQDDTVSCMFYLGNSWSGMPIIDFPSTMEECR